MGSGFHGATDIEPVGSRGLAVGGGARGPPRSWMAPRSSRRLRAGAGAGSSQAAAAPPLTPRHCQPNAPSDSSLGAGTPTRQTPGSTPQEADALDQVLSGCTSTEMVMFARGAVPAPAAPTSVTSDAIAEWDDNGNGRITCAEARAHGIAPVTRDHPAYPFMRDGDGDGIVCESGSSRSSPRTPAARPAPTQTACGPYRNCTALRLDHPNGVRRRHCAYQRRMDRDNDGWACER